MPFDTCYRCYAEVPWDKRCGQFTALHRLPGHPNAPEGIPFIGILCLECSRDLGDWLKRHPREDA